MEANFVAQIAIPLLVYYVLDISFGHGAKTLMDDAMEDETYNPPTISTVVALAINKIVRKTDAWVRTWNTEITIPRRTRRTQKRFR